MMNPGTLYLCPTPLGNLEDITLRVLRVLQEASLVAAEDTRHTRKLFSHFNIPTRLTSYHEHNKNKKKAFLLGMLMQGEDVALVSDAGTPGISDPGEELVAEAINSGIPVVSLPGPTALVTALVASGLPVSPFAFYGFPAARGSVRSEFFNRLCSEDKTVVFFEAPHRLIKALSELAGRDAGRKAVVARELTKMHEEFVRGTLGDLLEHFTKTQPRGECTVILAARESKPEETLTLDQLVQIMEAAGMTKKEAVREAAKRLGVPRREAYRQICIKEESKV